MAAQDAGEDDHRGDYADPDANRVMATVYAFMDGLEARDAEAMRAQVIDGASVTVVRQTGDGNIVRNMEMDAVIDALAAAEGTVLEPLFGEYPILEGPVAIVWAPFIYYRDGAFSHCGVNIFNLVDTGADWRIASVTYSHVEEGCMEPANR
ncbi:hypothetical protein [Aurantiacibacter gangjinensis]|uniref:hypothetical protein n=1 Tax=Aurantiacibacter gangjinensis TaxID=502682 RepID=UPI0012E0831F|nr:hypothetical protein [Aurantiacibacter gangjinensis]